jgi:hypothetical protein
MDRRGEPSLEHADEAGVVVELAVDGLEDDGRLEACLGLEHRLERRARDAVGRLDLDRATMSVERALEVAELGEPDATELDEEVRALGIGRQLDLALEDRRELGVRSETGEERHELVVQVARGAEALRDLAEQRRRTGEIARAVGPDARRLEQEATGDQRLALARGTRLERRHEIVEATGRLVQSIEDVARRSDALAARRERASPRCDRAIEIFQLVFGDGPEPLGSVGRLFGVGRAVRDALERRRELRGRDALRQVGEGARRLELRRGIRRGVEHLRDLRRGALGVAERGDDARGLDRDERLGERILGERRGAREELRRVLHLAEGLGRRAQELARRAIGRIGHDDLLEERPGRREVVLAGVERREPLLDLEALGSAAVLLELGGEHARDGLVVAGPLVRLLERRGGSGRARAVGEELLGHRHHELVVRVGLEHGLDVRRRPLDLVGLGRVDLDQSATGRDRGFLVSRRAGGAEALLQELREVGPFARVAEALLERSERRRVTRLDLQDRRADLDRFFVLALDAVEELHRAAKQIELLARVGLGRGEVGQQLAQACAIAELHEDLFEELRDLGVAGRERDRLLEVGARALGVAHAIDEEARGGEARRGLRRRREELHAAIAEHLLEGHRELGHAIVAHRRVGQSRPQLRVRLPLCQGGRQHLEDRDFVLERLIEKLAEQLDAQRGALGLRFLHRARVSRRARSAEHGRKPGTAPPRRAVKSGKITGLTQ